LIIIRKEEREGKMNIKTVGYFKEMPHGNKSSASIYDYINNGNAGEIEHICHYLESGIEFIVSPEISEDIINPAKGTAGVISDYTDGTWLWPGDLSYYVKNYGLKIPEEFLQTMRANNWKVPITLDDLDFDDIEIDGKKVFDE